MARNDRQQQTQMAVQESLDNTAAEKEVAEQERVAQEESEARAQYEAQKEQEQEAEVKQTEENTPDTVQEGTLDTGVLEAGEVVGVNETATPVGESIADGFISQGTNEEGNTTEEEPIISTVEPEVQTNALELQNVQVEKPLSEAFDANALLESLSPLGQTAFYQIQEYMDAMAPNKPMTEVEGVKHQVKLYRALDIVFNRLSDDDFRKFYPALLYLFHEYGDDVNGVFSMVYVYRFPEYLTLSTVEQEAFHRLLNMMIVTANPVTRPDAIRTLNWTYTLQVGLTDDARARIQSFYQV